MPHLLMQFLMMLLLLILSAPTYSQALRATQRPFVPLAAPSEKSLASETSSLYRSSAIGLDNDNLIQQIESIRDQRVSIEHRSLNHQWMADQASDDTTEGSKVISKIIREGLGDMWDEIREEKFKYTEAIPDSGGSGKFTPELDYKLRVSEDEIKMGIEYEF